MSSEVRVAEAPAPDTAIPALPIEIGFLANHGISPTDLAIVAHRARRLGVSPAREAIASGLIDETGFYRALAQERGLRFHGGRLRFMPGGDHYAMLRAGRAILLPDGTAAPCRFALAPEDGALRQFLEIGPHGRTDICIVTPGAFAAELRRANAWSLAHRLAGRDEAGRDRVGAWHGSSRGQAVTAGAAIGAAGIGGAAAPLETFFALALLLGPVFLALIYLRLAATIERPPGDLWTRFGWRIDDGRLPVYTVAVPLAREEAVLDQLLDALAALDYPPAKLDILLLVEADDRGTTSALAALDLPPGCRVVTVPPGKPRTKPRALNLALIEARGGLFTIFDAEDVPDPQQLRLAAARFLGAPSELACLQARLTIRHAGEGLLPALFALEYAGLFEVLNPGLLQERLPILLGGTSNHFRTVALRTVGGWDAWNVTEDADLGVRLVRAGYRIGDLPSRTHEEAPLSVHAWLKQRSRWIKGYMQTLVTHLRAPRALLREAGPVASLTFLALCLGTVATALGYPVFAVALALAAWNGSLWLPLSGMGSLAAMLALTVSLFGLVAILLPPAIGAVRRGAPGLLRFLPFLPLYYGLVSLAAWLALYEFLAHRYRWNKTMHGSDRPGFVSHQRVGA
jgi:cellulose synthase/poly-beta-1,6-N-acetylglucosamine synthase-like glycosyltransferase